MSPVYKLRDYTETFKFEREHPKQLRWDDKYKLFMLTEDGRCQGIWLRDKTNLVGEIILTWQSNSVLHIDSFTVSPSHQGKGLGYDLVKLAIEWGTNSDFKFITGEARQGKSWHIINTFGAEEVLIHENWENTGENYVFFKLTL